MKTPYTRLAGALLPVALLFGTLAGCGGGGSGGGSTPPPPPPTLHNMTSVTVDGGPNPMAPIPNILYATITVCAPGSLANCQVISHVQIDTQSVGLRLLASVLTPALAAALLPTIDATSQNQIFECIPFADGYSWGPITKVDLQLSSTESVSGLPTHLIEDPAAFKIPAVPADCPAASGNPNNPENTPASFGANAILGLGALLEDCGSACANSVPPIQAAYYACTAGSSGTCSNINLATAQQLQNPVATLVGADNNGVVLTMPAVASPGAATATGTLYFGVGTETNNHIPASANVLPVDVTFGQFIYAVYNDGQNNVGTPLGALDAGSSAYFFTGQNPPFIPCTTDTGFYCPSSTVAMNTQVQGETNYQGPGMGTAVAIDLNVDSIEAILTSDPSLLALPTVAGSTSQGFVYGLPFFYGRTVVVVFENRSSADVAQNGPYMAF
jgi:hypothetical protein